MQNFIKSRTFKTCLSVLSLAMLAQAAFCYDSNNVAYLDGVSSSYLYDQQSSDSAENGAIEATFKLDSKKPITTSSKKVNLSLREADIQQVLRMLADRAGVNIVFDQSVEGKLTLDLHDVPLNDAFMLIFNVKKLAYSMDGNTITVMSEETFKNSSYTRQNMTVLPIKYVGADKVAEFLNKNLFESGISGLSSKSIVTSNPNTNQIVVFGTNSDVMAIKRILPVIDVKPIMKNFVVSHTTPKEMANLICDSLFYESGEEGTTRSQENSDTEEETMILGGGVLACRDKVSNNDNEGEGTNLASFKGNPLTVTYFNELGKVGVYGGSIEQVNMIEDFIKQHDKKQLMAYVELSVIELNETGSKEFENTWNLWTPFIALSFDPSNGLKTQDAIAPFYVFGNRVPTAARSTTNPIQPLDLKSSNNSALTYQLKYLVETGNGRVVTNPKIMVTNGRKATIDMTSDYVKSVTTQVLEGSTTITNATQRTYDIGNDEGLLIEIVPFISPDGYVSMNITPEFATIKERIYAINSQGDEELGATLLQRRDLELKNIRIRDGETLVLAGLIRESEQQTTKKMPILSDLPLVGPFFRASTSNKSRDELVIVVTPHIVMDPDELKEYKQKL